MIQQIQVTMAISLHDSEYGMVVGKDRAFLWKWGQERAEHQLPQASRALSLTEDMQLNKLRPS